MSRKGKTDYRAAERRINMAFNQDMENRKANLTSTANRRNLMSHQMTVCKTCMTDKEMGQENLQTVTPLRARNPWNKGRFHLSHTFSNIY